MSKRKTALIVEGGAMRGIFSAGVLDSFIREQFDPFDMVFGVSAGAGNLSAYLGDMFGRNYKVYTHYSIQPEFVSFWRFLRGGHLMDLDWLWNRTISEIRLDLKTIFSKQKEFYVVVTSVDTGQPVYLEPSENTLEYFLKVSSSLPLFYRNFLEIDGEKMTDGGVADSIPVREAIRRGATEIMVLRSRKKSYVKTTSVSDNVIPLFFRKYPALTQTMKSRASIYMESVEMLRHPPDGVRIFEISPPETSKTGRLTRDLSILEEDYHDGLFKGNKVIELWQSTLR